MTTPTKRPTPDRGRTAVHDLDLATPQGDVPLRLTERDRTRTYLVLHGGAGPASVATFGDLLAGRQHARVLAPTHPGFDDTRRPPSVATVRDLAALYVTALDRLDLDDVTVVGNSLGGWIAAEIALLASPRVAGAVMVDAVGADLSGVPVVDVRTLSPEELRSRSFADPSRFAPAPGGAGPTPEMVRANLAALYTYGGETMSDPSLLDRLRHLDLPVQVIWGAADRIVTPEAGRALADAIPGAAFTVIDDAGHLPQIEAPEQVLEVLLGWAADR